jgi:putative ABC transport system permease protein
LAVVGAATTGFVLSAVIGPKPGYAPGTTLAIFAMVIGQGAATIGLVLTTLADRIAADRGAIEFRLALGHPPHGALGPAIASALTAGIAPIVATMAAAGFAMWPAMTSGLLIAGVEPIEAAKYQIVMLFALLASTVLTALAAAFGGIHLLTDRRHRLRPMRDVGETR